MSALAAPPPRLVDLVATASPAELTELRAALGTTPRLAYSPAEVAAVVGLSRSKVMALIASGDLPSVKIDRSRRVLHDDVVAWLADLRRGAEA